MLTFGVKNKVFDETLETMTIQFHLAHNFKIEVKATGTCEGENMQLRFYVANGDKKMYFRFRAAFQVLQGLKTGSVVVRNEGKLFRATAVKQVPQYWRRIPQGVQPR